MARVAKPSGGRGRTRGNRLRAENQTQLRWGLPKVTRDLKRIPSPPQEVVREVNRVTDILDSPPKAVRHRLRAENQQQLRWMMPKSIRGTRRNSSPQQEVGRDGTLVADVHDLPPPEVAREVTPVAYVANCLPAQRGRRVRVPLPDESEPAIPPPHLNSAEGHDGLRVRSRSGSLRVVTWIT